jgi:CHAD domain-containing protein
MHAAKERSDVPAPNSVGGGTADLVAVERPETTLSPQWVKLQALALQQLDRFMSLEPKVLRGDDPEAIHDMRVASRRLQQFLDLIYPPPAAREVRRLRRRIQRCRRALGEVRNCDVLLQSVEKALSSKRNSRREVWETAKEYLQGRRSESFDKAIRKLGKTNVAALYVALKEHLVVNGPGPEHSDSSQLLPESLALDTVQFSERVAGSLGSAWEDFVEKVAESHRHPQVSALHAVRIAAKRLRYLVEVLEEFDVPGSRESSAWLRGLQQHLGDWHDLEVMERVLTEMVAQPRFLRDHLEIASGSLQLIRRNRSVKTKFEEKYQQVTRDSAQYEYTKGWATHLISSPTAGFPAPA